MPLPAPTICLLRRQLQSVEMAMEMALTWTETAMGWECLTAEPGGWGMDIEMLSLGWANDFHSHFPT